MGPKTATPASKTQYRRSFRRRVRCREGRRSRRSKTEATNPISYPQLSRISLTFTIWREPRAFVKRSYTILMDRQASHGSIASAPDLPYGRKRNWPRPDDARAGRRCTHATASLARLPKGLTWTMMRLASLGFAG